MRLINFYFLFVFFIVVSSSFVISSELFMAYTVDILVEGDDFKINNVSKGLVWNSNSYKLQSTYYNLSPDLDVSDFSYSYSISNSGLSLSSGNFFVPEGVYLSVPGYCFDDNYIGDDCVSFFEPDILLFTVNIPYNPRGLILSFYDPSGRELLEVDVSSFSNYCGDNICSSRESFFSCPKDCEEEPLIFEDKFLASNFIFSSSSKFEVFFNKGLCFKSAVNCVEDLASKSNIFVNEYSNIIIDDKSGEYNVFFNEDASVLISSTSEVRISKDDFKISFDDLASFGKISKEYVDEVGNTCVEVFDPSSNFNTLSRVC